MHSGPTRGGLPLLLASAGLIVWAVCFVALYGAHALGCEAGWQEIRVGELDALALALVLLWLAHLAVLIALYRRFRVGAHSASAAGERPGRFLLRIGEIVTIAGFAATIWIGLPLLILTPCA